ncbi:MAG: HPr family phosphocarrier protein [Chthoniobacterales bacterium]|jgi:phosphotransferase system HPr (HPr) family protein
MQRTKAVVSSRTGLNVILATRLATAAKRMQSVVLLKSGGHVAEARNTLSLLGLCAVGGTTIDIEASGEDERDAADLVESILSDSVR